MAGLRVAGDLEMSKRHPYLQYTAGHTTAAIHPENSDFEYIVLTRGIERWGILSEGGFVLS